MLSNAEEIRRIQLHTRFEAWTGCWDGNLKLLNGKLDALVYGTVRPIAGSLLVAGALFCLGNGCQRQGVRM